MAAHLKLRRQVPVQSQFLEHIHINIIKLITAVKQLTFHGFISLTLGDNTVSPKLANFLKNLHNSIPCDKSNVNHNCLPHKLNI